MSIDKEQFIKDHATNEVLETVVKGLKKIDVYQLTVPDTIAFYNAICNVESARTLHVISTLLTIQTLGG